MKKILLIIIVGIAIFAGVLAALPGFIDWTKHKQEIVSQIHAATGYDVAINGGLSVALLPFPHGVVEDLSISSPAGGTTPLISLDRAEVSVALLPLLSGHVTVDKVSLVNPKINLEIAADGTPSWMTPELKSKMPGSGTQAPAQTSPQGAAGSFNNAVALNGIGIENGSFKFTDMRSGQSYALDKINASAHADTLSGPYDLSGGFAYNGQDVKLSLKAGRIESGADSVAVQVLAEVPDSSTKLSYSGIVALKGEPGIQGETDLDTASLKKLAGLAGASLPPALNKRFGARGILTASPDGGNYNNLKLSWAGAEFSGSFAASGLKRQPGTVPDFKISLDAAKPIDLATFLPAPETAQKGKGGGTDKDGDAKTAQPSFLPDGLTLPFDMTATVAFSAPSATYKGLTLDKPDLSASIKDRKIDGKLSASLPGDGAANLSFTLGFGSASTSEKTGALTLSDPALAWQADVKTSDGMKLASAFLPPDSAQKAAPFLKGSLAVNAAGDVKAYTVTVSSAAVKTPAAALNLNGSYAMMLKGNDLLTLGVAADSLDLDKFLGAAPAQQEKSGKNTGMPQAAPDIRKQAAAISLPFDLDLTAALNEVHVGGADYSKIAFAGRLAGKKLTVRSFEADDKAGNVVIADGTAGDISALRNLDVSVQVKAQDAKTLLKHVSVDISRLPDALAEANVVSEFKGDPDKLSFTANVKAMGGSLDASGTATDLLDIPTLGALTVRLKDPNYVDVIRLFDPGFTSGVAIRKNLDVFADIKRKDDVYTLNSLQATLGPTTLAGDVTIDLTGSKPYIKAKLQAGAVPLDELTGHEELPRGESHAQIAGQGNARWPRSPIDVSWMQSFDMDLNATADSLSYGSWTFSHASADLTLQNGVLTVNKIGGILAGGTVTLNGKVMAPAKARGPLSAEGKAILDNVSLESFVKSFSGSSLLSASGSISLSADLSTSGASEADLVSALQGNGKADGQNLVFNGFNLAQLSRSLAQPSGSLRDNLTSLLTATMTGGSTSFAKLTSSFTVDKGIITFNELNLTGQDANVSSAGNVNLPLWTIDLDNTITLAEPKDAPPLKVTFKGPLDQPAKAFGKSALDSYFGAKIQNLLLQELQKKKVLPGILGAPTPAPAPGQTQTQPQKLKPKDLLKGVLQGVLQGQH